MRDRYRLSGLNDNDLVTVLPKLVRRDCEHTADLIAHLAELDERRLYDAMGFHSMWEYCLVALRMCQTTAWRRLTAGRICRRFAGNFERVARGELQVAGIAALSKYLTDENGAELLTACVGKSFREVERLIARRFPKPDLADSIRRVTAKPVEKIVATVVLGPTNAAPCASAPIGSIDGSETKNHEQKPEPISSPPNAVAGFAQRLSPQRDRVEPLSEDRFAVRFTADAEFLELLAEVRGLGSHRGDADLLRVLKAGLGAYQRELLKQRFAVGRTPRKVRTEKPRSEAEPGARAASEVKKGVATPEAGATPETGAAPETGATTGAEAVLEAGSASGEAVPDAGAAPGGVEAMAEHRRHVPAEVAREVYLRDGGQCTFVAQNGRRCSARRQLQLAHITPHARRGPETTANLRLRCQVHNQLAARRYFGAGYMRSVMKRVANRERSE